MGVDDSLGETGRSGSEEEDSLGIWLGRGEFEVLGASLGLDGILDIIKQFDVQAGSTGLVELTRSDLVGQPDGFHAIRSQEGIEVFDVSFAVVELSGKVWKEAGNETSAESSPDGQRVVLVGGQVDNDDGLLASGGGANGGRTEGGHEGKGDSPDGGLEPRNIVGLSNSRRSYEGERPVSVGLSGPGKQVGKSARAR